jgi:hypothetical protein
VRGYPPERYAAAPGETLATRGGEQAMDTVITGPFEIKVFKITEG